MPKTAAMSWASSFSATALKKSSRKSVKEQSRVVTPRAVGDSGDFGDVCLDPDVSRVRGLRLVHSSMYSGLINS